ncbi:MAG: beta-lactamase family protein [Oscillospiraceae bacterium]|nr:beta-lactamase family protein [Oscillospiraceae bacterium]
MDFTKLKELMQHFVDEEYAPGNTIRVCIGNEVVFDYSCGYSNINNKKEMRGDEFFYLYSCSKITTVTAALQLLEKGVFSLDDPLYEYIPEYRNMYIQTENGDAVKAKKDIKIINLFNMTAGLTYNVDSSGIKKARELTCGRMDTDVVVRKIASDPLSFEPGERFQYSLCHDVLAGLVSIVSGMKFRDYVKENIFKPLGMNSSVYHMTDEIRWRMATQYQYISENSDEAVDIVEAQKTGNDKKGRYEEVGFKNSLVLGEEYDSGGAGIISTVADYMKLATALANHGLGQDGERILSASTVDLMRTNTLSETQLEPFNWKQLIGYGYGLGVRTMMDKEKSGSLSSIGEFGWGGAAGASVYIDPDIKLSAVYAKHTLNPREEYYQPKVRDCIYSCL